jgi:shikimate dehydrogenase
MNPSSIRRACIVGHPVAHSRSPLVHGYWLRALGISGAYERADVTPADFPEFFRHLADRGYIGANITVPHKEAAFQLADRLDDAARAIGAVNTVWYEGGELVASNSDGAGFIANLDDSVPNWQSADGYVVVLGAGGAARSVVFALLERRCRVAVVNRTSARAQALASRFGAAVSVHEWGNLGQLLEGAFLLVNTTSLGMAGQPPLAIDLAPLPRTATVYDIVYVPLETVLLHAARQRGHRTVDGLGMLLHQAVYGFRRWFNVTPQVTPELRALIEDDIRAKTGGH